MADSLVDLGGGVKMVNPESFTNSNKSGISEALSLINLQQNAQMLPLQLKKLEIDTALSANELMNLNVKNLLERAQLGKAIGDEQRARSKFFTEFAKDLPNLYRVDKNLGDAALRQLHPEASSTVNSDGTISVEFPKEETRVVEGQAVPVTTRETVKFDLDPNQRDPEKQDNLEGQWYDRFSKNDSVQKYREVASYYRTMKDSAKLGTAQGDLSIIFSFMKILDPTSSVREGEQATAKNAPAVPDQVRNMWNRALSKEGAFFGDKNSTTRTQFLDAAQATYDNRKADVIQVGRDIVDFAKRERLNPRNVISPVGDLSEDDFVLTDDEIVAKAKALLNKGKP